jgi:hypothetical protein
MNSEPSLLFNCVRIHLHTVMLTNFLSGWVLGWISPDLPRFCVDLSLILIIFHNFFNQSFYWHGLVAMSLCPRFLRNGAGTNIRLFKKRGLRLYRSWLHPFRPTSHSKWEELKHNFIFKGGHDFHNYFVRALIYLPVCFMPLIGGSNERIRKLKNKINFNN